MYPQFYIEKGFTQTRCAKLLSDTEQVLVEVVPQRTTDDGRTIYSYSFSRQVLTDEQKYLLTKYWQPCTEAEVNEVLKEVAKVFAEVERRVG